MAVRQKVIILAAACMVLSVTGCAPYQLQGGATGVAAEGLTGTRLDQKTSWVGGVVGAGSSAVASATIADISARGSREAVLREQSVEYRTADGRGRYCAVPLEYASHTKCRKVREKIYDDGALVKERVKEVCAS